MSKRLVLFHLIFDVRPTAFNANIWSKQIRAVVEANVASRKRRFEGKWKAWPKRREQIRGEADGVREEFGKCLIRRPGGWYWRVFCSDAIKNITFMHKKLQKWSASCNSWQLYYIWFPTLQAYLQAPAITGLLISPSLSPSSFCLAVSRCLSPMTADKMIIRCVAWQPLRDHCSKINTTRKVEMSFEK